MTHSKARNVIERAFRLLKKRWAILRSQSFYDIKVQNRMIMACVLLHNFIRLELHIDPMEELLSDGDEDDHEDNENMEFIDNVEPSQFWTNWRASGKKSNGKKRKPVESLDPLCDFMKTFCRNTDVRLGDIAKQIGYEYDISVARKEVFGAIGNIQGLTLRDKLLVSKLLVKNTEDLELFFSLLEEARAEFARMKLACSL
ncbi:hypothetical protein DH2020_044604 [Rehmannia glutinosa]|uniref:DDE Tnp4 domain-containing protein n=1 Tax=Rehmannia glutinosa TaxID=99300 RepID=A0ABR0UH82_REHGL